MSSAALMTLVRTIVIADDTVAFHLLAANPALAKARFEIGATRQTAETFYLDEIGHYIYAGDTALHLAAAAYRPTASGAPRQANLIEVRYAKKEATAR